VYEVNNKTEEVIFKLNENSEEAFALFKNYKIAIEFLEISRLFHPKKSTPADFYKTHKLINDFQNMKLDSGTNELETQVKKHIEGAFVGPITVALAMNGFFHKYFME